MNGLDRPYAMRAASAPHARQHTCAPSRRPPPLPPLPPRLSTSATKNCRLLGGLERSQLAWGRALRSWTVRAPSDPGRVSCEDNSSRQQSLHRTEFGFQWRFRHIAGAEEQRAQLAQKPCSSCVIRSLSVRVVAHSAAVRCWGDQRDRSPCASRPPQKCRPAGRGASAKCARAAHRSV